jgi:hypothetical protein
MHMYLLYLHIYLVLVAFVLFCVQRNKMVM